MGALGTLGYPKNITYFNEDQNMCNRVFKGAEFNGVVYFPMQVPVTLVWVPLGTPKIKLPSMRLKTCVIGFSGVLNSMVGFIF